MIELTSESHNVVLLTPENPSVRWWKERLKDAPVSELIGVVSGDPDAVDASHYYAAQLLLDEHQERYWSLAARSLSASNRHPQCRQCRSCSSGRRVDAKTPRTYAHDGSSTSWGLEIQMSPIRVG